MLLILASSSQQKPAVNLDTTVECAESKFIGMEIYIEI